MERILASPLFTHSKRYPNLFRYIVERTLEGRIDRLKERILGVEVFGRSPDYDTNDDPVVRMTAGEIRKRIAQYYHEIGHEHETRIDLPCGSYVAEFRAPVELEIVTPLTGVPAPRNTLQRTVLALYFVGAAIAAGLLLFVAIRPHTALDRFWTPVWDAPGSVLLCMGGSRTAASITQLQARSSPADAASEITMGDMMKMDSVAFSDAVTLSRLGGLLQSKNKNYRAQRGISTSFADLRNGPAVLIGGFNNAWTLRLTSQLRFTFERDSDTHIHWIRDRQNPSQRNWSVDIRMPYLMLEEDYALISRFWDATTERLVVVAAGINNYGTIAAGEFLTTPAYMEAISKLAPGHWEQKNMQFVIATKVINGNSGPPRIVAAHFW
jgi:hypothetical protein